VAVVDELFTFAPLGCVPRVALKKEEQKAVAVELFEEHSVMLEAAEEFLAALRSRPRISLEKLSRMRVRLSSLIRQHRVTEEAFIYGPLMRDGGFGNLPHLEPIVQHLMREKVKYSEHIRKWTPLAIERDWEGYVRACEERLRAFKRVLLDEEATVYQTVLRLDPAQMPRRA
jgi:hypothetical protein